MAKLLSKIIHRLMGREPNPGDDTRALLPGYDIGKETYGRPSVLSWGESGNLIIGSYCSIGGGVQILLGGNHRTEWVSTFPFPARWSEAAAITGHPWTKGDVVIGHDVWIGRQAVILSGVTINTGAVIGCNSVVTRNVPPYTLVTGNPAREIGKRFPDEQIGRLLSSRWWELDREQLVPLLTLLCSTDIDGFLDRVDKLARPPRG